MEFNKKTKKTIIFIAFICILFFLAVKNIGLITEGIGSGIELFKPFIIGASIAFVINIPMGRLESFLFSEKRIGDGSTKKSQFLNKAKRPLSFLITLALVIAVLAIATNIVVPQLATTLQEVSKQLPGGVSKVQQWIDSNMDTFKLVDKWSQKINLDWEKIANQVSQLLKEWGSDLVNSGYDTVKSIVSGLVNFFIGFFFSIYILLQKETLGSQSKQLIYSVFSESVADRFLYILSLANDIFAKFFMGQCVEAFVLGCMFFVAMSLFGLPYALMISVMIAFLALIPIVGSFIGCFVGVILILMVSPTQALLFLVIFIVIQQIEGNFVYPYVVGNSVGLPSIWVLVAVTIGGNLMGVLGMIIFIPMFSVIYSLATFYIKESLERRGVDPSKWLGETDVDRDALRLKRHQD